MITTNKFIEHTNFIYIQCYTHKNLNLLGPKLNH